MRNLKLALGHKAALRYQPGLICADLLSARLSFFRLSSSCFSLPGFSSYQVVQLPGFQLSGLAALELSLPGLVLGISQTHRITSTLDSEMPSVVESRVRCLGRPRSLRDCGSGQGGPQHYWRNATVMDGPQHSGIPTPWSLTLDLGFEIAAVIFVC
jgi:hypothetical protein